MKVSEIIKALSMYPEDSDIKVVISNPQFDGLDFTIDGVISVVEMDTDKSLPGISLSAVWKDGLFGMLTQFTKEPSIEVNKKPWGGWQSIYDEYYAKIESEGAVNIYAKQKYGFLRFEVDYSETADYNEIQRLMDEAEDKSLTVCEDCGGVGTGVEVGGRFYTLCKQCTGQKK